MTSIQQRSAVLAIEIYAAKYFVAEFHAALKSSGMTVDVFRPDEYTDQQLVLMWNEMWLSLPDDASCRREPFFALCDICEEIFDGQDEPEDD